MANDNMVLDGQRQDPLPQTVSVSSNSKSLLNRIGVGTVYFLMFFLAFTTLFPFYFMINTSLMTITEAFTYPPHFFPPNPQWRNYILLFEQLPFARFFLNSIIHVIGVIAGRFFIVTMAGYAFARINFPGRDKIFLGFLELLQFC